MIAFWAQLNSNYRFSRIQVKIWFRVRFTAYRLFFTAILTPVSFSTCMGLFRNEILSSEIHFWWLKPLLENDCILSSNELKFSIFRFWLGNKSNAAAHAVISIRVSLLFSFVVSVDWCKTWKTYLEQPTLMSQTPVGKWVHFELKWTQRSVETSGESLEKSDQK